MSVEYTFSPIGDCPRDIKVLVCLHVPDENMKDLVLVDKEISQICSEENFYRKRIVNFFGADLVGYCKPPAEGVSKSYRDAYRGLAHLFCAEHHHKWAEEGLINKPASWCTFVFACVNGHIPIIDSPSKKAEITQLFKCHESNVEGWLYGLGCTVRHIFKWDVLDILIKDYGAGLYHNDTAYYLVAGKDIEEFKKWIKRGLDLRVVSISPLTLATKLGLSDMAIFLIENGAPFKYDTSFSYGHMWDMPPLIHALKTCSLKVVKMLIERGEDIHYNRDMVFKRRWWKGFGHTQQIREVIEYLSGLGEFTND